MAYPLQLYTIKKMKGNEDIAKKRENFLKRQIYKIDIFFIHLSYWVLMKMEFYLQFSVVECKLIEIEFIFIFDVVLHFQLYC